MVQITFDTQHDTLEDLEQAQHVLRDAIARRKGTLSAPVAAVPAVSPLPPEDTIETPFMKISFSNEETPAQPAAAQAPTLNQLLQDASLTDAEMSQMFKQVEAADAPVIKPKKKESSEAAFIEIVEFEEEAEKK